MPPRKRAKKGAGAEPPEDNRDHISALPDDVLRRVLGNLPAQDAVRTCVLARRWRHLWKSATSLQIRGRVARSVHVKELREFLYHLLLLRGGAPLRKCEFSFSGFDMEDVPRVNLWFRHAIMCQVNSLKLRISRPFLELENLPIVSQHLTSLRLAGVGLRSSFLDFSSCRALNFLELKCCIMISGVKKISSESLEELAIIQCSSYENSRICIFAPNIVLLEIDDFRGRTPVLEAMPKLKYAFVEITKLCKDDCTRVDYEDCDCVNCDNSDNIGCNCVLLEGLCKAEALELISVSKKFIFKRDLRCCPTFYNLKTLILNDYWCVPDDFRSLACILLHSPILKKLTLQLFSEGPQYKVEMKGSVSLMERSEAISKHLEIVEVKCDVVDEFVLKLLTFLCKFNISKPACHTLPASIFLRITISIVCEIGYE